MADHVDIDDEGGAVPSADSSANRSLLDHSTHPWARATERFKAEVDKAEAVRVAVDGALTARIEGVDQLREAEKAEAVRLAVKEALATASEEHQEALAHAATEKERAVASAHASALADKERDVALIKEEVLDSVRKVRLRARERYLGTSPIPLPSYTSILRSSRKRSRESRERAHVRERAPRTAKNAATAAPVRPLLFTCPAVGCRSGAGQAQVGRPGN